MKSKFITPYNGTYDHKKYREKNLLPSLTIPDMSMDIRTILERYARGLPINQVSRPIQEGADEDFEDYTPDPRTMDISERYEYARQAREYIKQARESKLADDKRRKENADKRAAELAKLLDERLNPKPTPGQETGQGGSA